MTALLQASLTSAKAEFFLDQPFDHETLDSREVRALVTFDKNHEVALFDYKPTDRY